jgi:hypothetical protein
MMRRLMGRLVVLAGLVLWVVVPVVCIWFVRERADRVRLRGNEATAVEVMANTHEVVADAGLRLRWANHPPVVAPAWSGTVTEVRAKPGDRTADGQVAVVIDGVERLLVASRSPFSRSLQEGDTGPDVADLNDLLRRRGLPAGVGDRFTLGSTRGVVALGRSIGAGPAEVFDPAWVIYLAHPGARITTVPVLVAAPAPAAGEVVFSLAPELVGADVIARQDAPPDAAPSGGTGDAAPSQGADTGSPASPTSDSGPVDALARVAPIEVPAGAALRIDTVELVVVEDRRQVAPRSLAELQAVVTTAAPYTDAVFATPAGPRELVVPAGAVISDQQGRSCVRTVGPAHGRSVEVSVVGGDGGQTVVVAADRGAVEPGDRVEVATPAGDRTCS